MLKVIFFATLLANVAPAIGQTPPGSPNSATASRAKPPSERIICETQQEIGSRLASKRVCMTASQWKDHEQQVHSQLNELHTNSQSSGGPG